MNLELDFDEINDQVENLDEISVDEAEGLMSTILEKLDWDDTLMATAKLLNGYFPKEQWENLQEYIDHN